MPAVSSVLRARNQLGGEPLAAITADGFAHVGQRGARSLFHIQHLLLGALRIAVHQLARQLGLQGDERQRVSQQIVQIARDAFALGDLGEMLNLLVSQPQLLIRHKLGIAPKWLPTPTRTVSSNIDPQKGSGSARW